MRPTGTALACLLVAGLAPAQSPTSPDLFLAALDAEPVPETVFFDRPGDGNLWARGASYKARFGADGVEYIPFLGSRAPQNFPFEMTFRSAAVGATRLDAPSGVEPVLEGSRVVYDRGGILEVYDLRPRSVEQTFLVPDAGTAGDLVVRLGLSTGMIKTGEDAAGFLFETAEGWGGVLYGRAVAVDAAGAQTSLPTSVDGETIEIRVPATTLEAAAFPLAIDPVLTTFCVDCGPADHRFPDVAFDDTSGTWCVVYEEVFSATDSDVASRRRGDVGGAYGAPLYTDMTATTWNYPSIGNNNLANSHLIAARALISSGLTCFPFAIADTAIRGRIRSASADTNTTAAFDISGGIDCVGESRPDVGGDAILSTPQNYLVVWAEAPSMITIPPAPPNANVAIAVVTQLATPVVATATLAGSSDSELNPRVSKSTGTGGNWAVVYQKEELSTTNVYLRVVSRIGFPVLGPLQLDPVSLFAPAATDENPDVAVADGDRFFAVWQREMPAGDHDILGRRVNGGAALSFASPITNLTSLDSPATQFLDQVHPVAAADGASFAFAYAESVSGTLDFDVRAAHLYGDSSLVVPAGEGHIPFATAVTLADLPQMASRWSASNAAADRARYVTVWEEINAISGGHDAREARHAPGDVSTTDTDCGLPGPVMTVSLINNAPSLGSTFTAIGLPSQSGTLALLIGAPGLLPLGCGSPSPCRLGMSTIYGVVSPFGAVLTVQIPNDQALIGAILALQVGEVGGTGSGGCNFGGLTVTVSDTLNVTVR